MEHRLKAIWVTRFPWVPARDSSTWALWQLFSLFWALSGFQTLRYVLNRYNDCKSGLCINTEYWDECAVISFSVLNIWFFEYLQKTHKAVPIPWLKHTQWRNSSGKGSKIIHTQFQAHFSNYFVHSLLLPRDPSHDSTDVIVAQLK